MIFSVQARLDAKGVNIELLDDVFIEQFRKAVGGIATATRDKWKTIAASSLKTSRDDYIQGLTKDDSQLYRRVGDIDVHEIQLVGKMANNFEFGMPSYDMKELRPGWLGGGKAKTNKDGKKYIVIPFRHSTGSSKRLSYTGKAAKMGLKKELMKTVKEYGLDKMVRTATGKVVEGNAKRVPNSSDVHSYLRGLVKVQKAVGGKTSTGLQRGQSQLMTFRVMSEDSPPESWQHPGLKPANLLPEVEKFVDNELNRIVDMILGGS